MSNQPFQIPKPNVGQVNRPMPGAPGTRLPGPLAGGRPGVPKPGFPGPGIKPQIPMNIGGNQQQIPSTTTQEEHKTPVETPIPEPIKTQQVEPKLEPIKTQLPIPGKTIPQIGKTTIPTPGFKPGPNIEPLAQSTKQPVVEEEPIRKPIEQKPVHKEPQTEQASDQLLRLSESLQAMKNLRSNFQGFNAETEGNEQGYDQNPEEYEGGEDDDYVRVEGTEDFDERGEYNNEDQYGQDEENQDENEGEENERYEEQERGEYYEDEEYRQEDLGYDDKKSYPQQTFTEPPRFVQETHEEKPYQPPTTKTSFKPEIKPPQHHHVTHPQHGVQTQGSAGIKQNLPQEVSSATGIKKEEITPSFSPPQKGKEVQESSFERVGGRSEEGSRSDPNLLLRIEKLELELDKERKKNAVIEREQDNLVQENMILKQKNSELTARLEILNRRGTTESVHNQEIEILKNELNRNIEETRQISDNANQMLHEASQYREESESLINGLVEEKNNLHHQILQLKREIDEEYVQKIEVFRQKTELFELKINEYETTFQLVQNQLRDKTETLHKIASLNSEIQTAISTIPKTSAQLHTQSPHVHLHPHHSPSTSQHNLQSSKPETKIQPPSQKTLDLPRAHISSTPQREEQKQTTSRKQSSTLSVHENQETKPSPRTTIQNTPSRGFEGETTQGVVNSEKEKPPSYNSLQQSETPSFPQGEKISHPPISHSQNVSSEGLSAPPNYRIPGKAKKEEKKHIGGFRPMAGANLFNEIEEKETHVEETNQPELKTFGNQPTSTQAPIQKSKITKMGAASLFEESSGGAESFFDSNNNQAQPSSNTQQKPRYPDENQYEHHEEAQEQPTSINPRGSGGKPKTNLRYSQNPVSLERDPTQMSVEAAENFFDQLGNTQNQTQQAYTNIPQIQTQTKTQPPTQIQKAEKPVQHTAIQRGRNPFAEEEESNSAADFFSSQQPESFVNRPEAQRFNQTRINAGPVQTGMPKKVEDTKTLTAGKGSALKKMKGNVPSSMFD